jgi:hypothetical protein
MAALIDWSEPDRFKVERSETFWPWGGNAVNIYRKSEEKWKLILPDFSPSVLRYCKFPRLLCKAAELTAEDGHVRLIGRKEITDIGEKIALVTRKNVVKPKLVLRRKE